MKGLRKKNQMERDVKLIPKDDGILQLKNYYHCLEE